MLSLTTVIFRGTLHQNHEIKRPPKINCYKRLIFNSLNFWHPLGHLSFIKGNENERAKISLVYYGCFCW
jgi:hypothetical protein